MSANQFVFTAKLVAVTIAILAAIAVLWYVKEAQRVRRRRTNIEQWKYEVTVHPEGCRISHRALYMLLHVLSSNPEVGIKEDEIILATRRQKIFLAPAIILALLGSACLGLAGYCAVSGNGTWNIEIPRPQGGGLLPNTSASFSLTTVPAARGGPAVPVTAGQSSKPDISPARGGQAKPTYRYFHIPVVLLVALLMGLPLLAAAFLSWLDWYNYYLMVTNLNVRLLTMPPFWLPWAGKFTPPLALNQIQDVNFNDSIGKIFRLGTVSLTTLMQDEDDHWWKNMWGWPKPEELSTLLNNLTLPMRTRSATVSLQQ